MQRLQEELIEWNADGTNESHIDAIREAVHANCPAIPPGDPSRARCEAFLKV
jgi:hypothetical protein